MGINSIPTLLNRRNEAVMSLLKSLAHLPRERQFAILTSIIPLQELEEFAKFQKEHDHGS